MTDPKNAPKSEDGKPYRIVLADDDVDDRFFFDKALKVQTPPADLTTVDDGEKLMDYLAENLHQLPDVVFLDMNMPRKNGSECLAEIKQNKNLDHIPVIIYSTSFAEDVADLLYANGAHYYIKKSDLIELQKLLGHVMTLIREKRFVRPDRANFKYKAQKIEKLINNKI